MLPGTALAAVPLTVHVDAAVMTAAGPAPDGDYGVIFSLYKDAAGGPALWQEGPYTVAVKGGALSWDLGNKVPIPPVLAAANIPGFIEVQILPDPALPRRPLGSVLTALRAAVAENLDCSGCIGAGQLDAKALADFAKTSSLAKVALSGNFADLSGGPDLSAYAKLVALAKVAISGSYNDLVDKPDLSVFAQKSGLSSVATTGVYADLNALPVLAKVGTACGSGLVVKGLAADGSLVCIAALDPSAIAADGLGAISNGLLVDVFTDKFANAGPIDVLNYNPVGFTDTLVVPDVGVSQTFSVSVDAANSDLTKFKLVLTDPNNKQYTLFDGGTPGVALQATYPAPNAPAAGDLTVWNGKNAAGTWKLQVVDNSFDVNNQSKYDGKLNSWSVNIKYLSTSKVAATGAFQFKVTDVAPVACNSSNFGAAYTSSKDNALYICNGKDFFPISLVAAGSASSPGASCKDILAKAPGSNDGTYWITGNGSGTFQVYCDMTTDGGGWTLVRNIAPNDGNSVGYNTQAFWTAQAEYGAFNNRFSNDYKSPADYLVTGTQLMIQSTNTGGAGAVLGWRRWPMINNQPRTFNSFFTTGIVAVHANDACETGASDLTNVGTTSAWDDVIRQGTCLYADINPSASGEADLIRLSTLPYNGQDNMMAGFASCIDCGAPWQGANPYQGLDRAACNSGGCSYTAISRLSSTNWQSADCVGNYCSGTYSNTITGPWNSRFFVR